MPLRDSLDPRASMWDFLAVYLHFLRNKHGLSCAAVGKMTNTARQTVSHWEAGRLKPSERQLRALDDTYGTGDLLCLLLHHARTGHDPNWFSAHLELEARASTIKIYERSLVPGLFQTEAYARTLFVQGGVQDIEESVAGRLARQETLLRPEPPLLWVLLEEDVIDRAIGEPRVMYEQLSRLLELAAKPHVMLRVVPRSIGFHPGLDGSFKLLGVARETLAYIEASGGGRLVGDPAEVHAFEIRYDRIGTDALSRSASRQLIEHALESMR
ncbi:helix-turn-helix transcriptional regulator [Spirillospora sp. NPDC029432]|uniref:helix-turn-helix domain-containing protein n=1 Tax=Spirillospora sp. NPDC029432 TaxID=3154599 RepID=UPI0034539E82